MKTRQQYYNEIAEVLKDFDGKFSVYKGSSDGEYIKIISGCSDNNSDQGFDCIDNVESDGYVAYDTDGCVVSGSTFVLIKTYENGEKLREPKMGKVSLIVNDEGFGFLQAVLLSNRQIADFSKFISSFKGTVEDFVLHEEEGRMIRYVPYVKKKKPVQRSIVK